MSVWKLIAATTGSGRALFECTGCGVQHYAPIKGHVCRVLVAGVKRKRLKLDPDLADGQHWTVHDKPDSTLLELLQLWMDEAGPGETIEIGIVEMTDHEVEGLKDI